MHNKIYICNIANANTGYIFDIDVIAAWDIMMKTKF